jgi:hypothetical protein
MTIARRSALKLCASAAALGVLPAPTMAQAATAPIDWPAFLARHDMVWSRLPKAWDEGPFLGNGMMGAQLYYDEAADALRLDVQRSDVQDYRLLPDQTGIRTPRLPIGHFLLRTKGKLSQDVKMRLVLHEAILAASITTDLGQIDLRLYVHADDQVIMVETTGRTGEADARWEWVGEEAISPRQTWGLQHDVPRFVVADYQNNPPGQTAQDGEEALWLQPLLVSGGGATTAWRQGAGRLIVSTGFSKDDLAKARATALASVRKAATDQTLLQRHKAWWRAYYPASFLSIPDTRVESFYWIQMYKLASATRADRPYIDNQGPWMQPSSWPYATWNLNVQLNYWAPLTANRASLAYSLVNVIHDHQQQLIDNAEPAYRHDSATMGRSAGRNMLSQPPAPTPGDRRTKVGQRASGDPPEVGNLPWALHNVWLVWRHTMDETVLRDTLYPVLRRTTNYYRHFLERGDDGRLHLPSTYSPEFGYAPDLNYDLAALRWSCTALLEAADRLKIADPLIPEWKRILVELVDYPRDETGFMIGAGQPLSASHRHYSHLLMVYPFYLVNRDQPGSAALIERSLTHWQSMRAALRGYSSTGGSSIASALGKGDDALKYLQSLFTEHLRPNTLYKETWPVIETPLSGAQSVHDMLLQSWGGVIRPFPAVPTAWPDAVFSDLSAEGGFLVSAKRQAGATRWISVKSRAAEPFVIETDIADPVASVNGQARKLQPTGPKRYRAKLGAGERILIHARGQRPDLSVQPLAAAGPANSFGLNPNQGPTPPPGPEYSPEGGWVWRKSK